MNECLCEGLYGHTAVFHNATGAIYVYGGYEVTAEGAGLSSSLYCVLLMMRDGVYDVRWRRIISTDNSQVLDLFSLLE